MFIRFFVEWCIDASCAASCFVMVIACASSYVGIILYITGMVRDLKARLASIEDGPSPEPQRTVHPTEIWSIYVREIRFHVEIIG